MKNLITSGKLLKMFLAEDANTIIRRPNCRKFCLDNDILSINYDDYFETVKNERSYAVETLKGYRRVLRTLFNEAVRYEWIAKNPVCGTKIGAGSSNTSLRAVPEKEVFSFKEAQEFLSMLDGLLNTFLVTDLGIHIAVCYCRRTCLFRP